MRFDFPVTVYGNLEKYNDVLSKGRCRIFYKYENRNGTYITDEFAEKLLSSVAYAPVKGIYQVDDYTDHGSAREEGRIYGIVPENPNVSWEKHLDEDGVEREYACVDVLIFTALYKEANEIIGKAQSMELYEPSISYHKAVYHGQIYTVFDSGCFLGLQVLGKEVEPCFEGAAFFSLNENIEKIIKEINNLSNNYSNEGGKTEMPKINFKLSDDQKYCAIWALLNPEYTEEGNWTCSYSVNQVFDDYALCLNYETGNYERVYYTKNDELDSVELGERIPVYIVDITEKEKATLDTLRQLNGDTYELVDEKLLKAEENFENCTSFSSKIEELNENVSTLNTEKSNLENEKVELENKIAEFENQVSTLSEENTGLKNYKAEIELNQKKAIVEGYEDQLDDEVLENYRNNFDKYSVLDLDKELAYEVRKIASPSNFSHIGLIPKAQEREGLEVILDNYVIED